MCACKKNDKYQVCLHSAHQHQHQPQYIAAWLLGGGGVSRPVRDGLICKILLPVFWEVRVDQPIPNRTNSSDVVVAGLMVFLGLKECELLVWRCECVHMLNIGKLQHF